MRGASPKSGEGGGRGGRGGGRGGRQGIAVAETQKEREKGLLTYTYKILSILKHANNVDVQSPTTKTDPIKHK